MIKHIFIFILFASKIWAGLNDLHLGGWTEMTSGQSSQLAGLLGGEQPQITVKEGKMQVVSGINYAVVFNHPDTGDCFSTFTFVAWDKSNPVHELALEQSVQQQMLDSIQNVNPCSQENLKVLFSKFEKVNDEDNDKEKSGQSGQNKSEPEEISLKSDSIHSEKDFVGGWKDIDEDDFTSIAEMMGLDNDTVSILEGKMQLVAGVNYVLLIQIEENDPCLLPFNFVSWKKNNNFSALPLEMFESSELLTTFSSQEFCEEMVLSQQLELANAHLSQPIRKMANVIQSLWKMISEDQTEILKTTLGLDEEELTIVEPPKTNSLNQLKISVLVEDKDSNPCVFILFLDMIDQTLSLVNMEQDSYSTMMGIFYKGKNPCGEEVTGPISSKIDAKEDYLKLFYSFFLNEDAEIKQVAQESKFNQWKVLSIAQIGSVAQFIKSEDKNLKPVLGMSFIENGIDYILIMRNSMMKPCTMYVSYTDNSGNKTFVYTSLLEKELTKDILQDISPCNEDDIAEYLENTQKFLLI